RSAPPAGRWYRGTPSWPAIPLLLDKRGHVDGGPRIDADARSRDEPPADLDKPWTGGHTLEPDAELVFRDLELRAGHQPGALPDGDRNYHSTCPINGRLHGITIPGVAPPTGAQAGERPAAAWAMNASMAAAGRAPVVRATSRPSEYIAKVGMERIWSRWPSSFKASVLTLTTMKRPPARAATLTSSGATIRQGPHHGAQ